MRKTPITSTREGWPVPPEQGKRSSRRLAGRPRSDTKGEEGKGKRVYFTQMPIREVRADNKRADACCFLSRSTGQERDVLDLQLLSSLRCLKWQQARNPADLKLPQKLSAPAITHAGNQANMFCPGSTDPAQPASLPMLQQGTAAEEGG